MSNPPSPTPEPVVQWATRTPVGRIFLAEHRDDAHQHARSGSLRRTVVYRTSPDGPWIADPQAHQPGTR